MVVEGKPQTIVKILEALVFPLYCQGLLPLWDKRDMNLHEGRSQLVDSSLEGPDTRTESECKRVANSRDL